MFDFKKLEERYCTDAAFNKLVNVTQALLRDYGFMPSEIREAQFLAQYMFEMSRPQRVIMTLQEEDRFLKALADLKRGLWKYPMMR